MYLDDVQCCSFVLDMYVVFEGEIGVEVFPKYLTLVDLLIDSPMAFIVVWVVLLSCCLLQK